jgi:hypothetical protein
MIIKFDEFLKKYAFQIVELDTVNFIIKITNSTNAYALSFSENARQFINELGMFILEEEILDKIDYEIDSKIESISTNEDEKKRKNEIFISLILKNTVLKTDDIIPNSNSLIYIPMLENKFNIEPNSFLNTEIRTYYNTYFYGYGKPQNPDYLNVLKNDNHQNWSNTQLTNAANQLKNVLLTDLPQIEDIERKSFTVCVVPRAKADNTYRPNQLLFKATVRNAVIQLGNGFVDGMDYITRHTNTRTTHLRNAMEGFVNDGRAPYAGITMETCNFSKNINGRDILLIDDIYTRTVNIDEDAIQALLTNGANSVTFYAIGNTIYNQHR